jgi:hypothetical protein
LNEAGTILYVGEFIGCTLFCVLFVLRSRGWWRTRMGPNLFAMMFVLAVLQGLSLVRLVIAQEWFMENQVVIRFWSFLALFIVVWWRVILLIIIQHEDAVRAHNDAEGAHEDAVGARDDAAGAHEDAVEARQDAEAARRLRRNGDTDPDLKPVR